MFLLSYVFLMPRGGSTRKGAERRRFRSSVWSLLESLVSPTLIKTAANPPPPIPEDQAYNRMR